MRTYAVGNNNHRRPLPPTCMRGDCRQNYKFSYAVLTWCFRLRKCCYALLIWHCKVQCRTFAFSYVFLNSVMFFCIVLCSSVLDFVLSILRYAKSNYAYCCNHAILFLCVVLWSFVLCWIIVKWIMLTSYPSWHSLNKIWTTEWGMGLVCQNGGPRGRW